MSLKVGQGFIGGLRSAVHSGWLGRRKKPQGGTVGRLRSRVKSLHGEALEETQEVADSPPELAQLGAGDGWGAEWAACACLCLAGRY